MIRIATLEDLDWLLDLARERYPYFEEDGARTWLTNVLTNQDVLCIRGEYGALVACAHVLMWNPKKPQVHMVFVVARPNRAFEGYRMLEIMVQWARSLGASAHFGEETGIDLAPYARRLGAAMDRPSWRVEG